MQDSEGAKLLLASLIEESKDTPTKRRTRAGPF